MTIIPTSGPDYRLLAAECEARAREASDPLEAGEWLRAARSWLFIAQELEGDRRETPRRYTSGEPSPPGSRLRSAGHTQIRRNAGSLIGGSRGSSRPAIWNNPGTLASVGA